MLVFFTNLSLTEFQVRYLAIFLLFWVIGGFGLFWTGNLHKSIQLILEFFKGPFLVVQFSFCTLMTFLMMLSVILLSVLMIPLSTLNLIRYLICGSLTTWIDFWIWIWSKRPGGLGQKVACWFQCWKNSTGFNWLV